MNSLSVRDREKLEQQCILLKTKYPDKCAVIVESNPLIKIQVPLEAKISKVINCLKQHLPEEKNNDIEILINRLSPVSEDRLFSEIFDAYAFRDRNGKDPLYLYISYRKKQPIVEQPQSSTWFGLWG